mgnify:CR=1 FL=1
MLPTRFPVPTPIQDAALRMSFVSHSDSGPSTHPRTANPSRKPGTDSMAAQTGQGLGAYLQGVRHEWHKITWPTWMQIWSQSLIVVAVGAFATVAIWLVDTVFRFVIAYLTTGAPPAA